MKYIQLSFILVFCCFGMPVMGSQWLPFIVNYGSKDYGNGASTWRIVPDGKYTFFANQSGLLTYNGVDWHRYPLNNRLENRSIVLSADEKRIYVGGENEFGYFVVNSWGGLTYHCMSDKAPKEIRNVGNIWDFFESNGIQYFRGDRCIIIVAGDKMNIVKSKNKMFNSIMINGTIYVTTTHGIEVFMGEQFYPIPNGKLLEGKRLNGLLSFGKGLLIATANDGLFYYNGKSVTPYKTNADDILKNAEISCMSINKGKIAIGTIHDGVVIINTVTGEWQCYNEIKGLQNNTVLSVAFDHEDNLWVGLDYGIDHILLESPFSYLYRSSSSLGVGYSCIMKDELLYLGTDRGLYCLSYPLEFKNVLSKIQRVSCPSGPAWYLYSHGGELFCMHDKGIFVVKGTTAVRVTNITGAWSCQAVNNKPDMMFIGVYDGMYVLRKINGVWTSLGKIRGINISGRYFSQSGKNTLKVYNSNVGTATEFTLDKSLTRVVKQRRIKGRLVDSNLCKLGEFVSDRNITGKILKVDKNLDIIPYEKGFMMMDSRKLHNIDNDIIITRMSITSADDSIVYIANYRGIKPIPRIRFNYNTIRFDYQVRSSITDMQTRYQYRFNNGEWSQLSDATSKEFGNLQDGEYTFEVRAVLYDGTVTTDTLTFVILPPWYLTWKAYLIYLLIILGGIFVFVKLEKQRVMSKQDEAVREKNKEVKQMKIEVDKLEKDKMDMDMRHKSLEITNLMLNLYRKNEILIDLKKDIQQIMVRVNTYNPKELKCRMLLINNKIDSNIESDNILKRFEQEFDMFNNNIIHKLSKLHPNLNNNEKLMCAYLRMNFSTKDIAPLLHLSMRGVESLRYRLRKKLNLDKNENITEYLNKL